MSNYTLHLGDCLEIMPSIPSGSIDAIIADWPYGTTACKWDSVIPLEPLWEECKRVIKGNGAIVLFGQQPFTSVLVLSNREWFKYALVWEKTRPSDFANAKGKPLSIDENIVIFSPATFGNGSINKMTYNPQGVIPATKLTVKRQGGESNRHRPGRKPTFNTYLAEYTNYPRSILRYSSTQNHLHPTQKPVTLMEYLIKTYTNPGDLVLDNTMGSGSTGEACLNTGRRFIGIEKDPEYFEIAQNRLERVEQELREAQIAKERQPYLMAEVTA